MCQSVELMYAFTEFLKLSVMIKSLTVMFESTAEFFTAFEEKLNSTSQTKEGLNEKKLKHSQLFINHLKPIVWQSM